MRLKRIFPVLIFSIVVFLSSEAQDLGGLFKRGKSLYNRGEYTEAMKIMDEIILQDNYYYNAYFRRSYCNFKLNLYSEALSDIEHAFEIDLLDNRYFYMKAMSLDKLHQYEAALFYLDMAINFSPRDFSYVDHRAGIYLELGRYEKAIQDFNRVIAQNPEDYSTYYGRGIAKFNLKNKTGACMDWLYAKDKDESCNRMFFYKCSDMDLRPYDFEKKPSVSFIEEPEFICDYDSNFYWFASFNLNYPLDALKEQKQGMVIAECILTSDKKIEGIKILRSPHESLSREVIRVIEKSAPFWNKPVLVDGIAADYKIILPFSFRICESGYTMNEMIDSLNLEYGRGNYSEAFHLAGMVLDMNPFLYEIFLIYKECGLKLKREVNGTEFYDNIRKEKAVFFDEITSRKNMVKLYYNNLGQLTVKQNSTFYRIAEMNARKLHGPFYDYTLDNKLIAQGNYFMNYRDSVFMGYHPNGKVKFEINFLNSQPKGLWRFYHPNGNLQYEFNVLMDNFDITAWRDSFGNEVLKAGNGIWTYQFLSYNGNDTITIEGPLINYKKEGDWKFSIGKDILLTEKYIKGKFIGGISYINNREEVYKKPGIKTWMITPVNIGKTEQLEIDPAVQKTVNDFLSRFELKITESNQNE